MGIVAAAYKINAYTNKNYTTIIVLGSSRQIKISGIIISLMMKDLL